MRVSSRIAQDRDLSQQASLRGCEVNPFLSTERRRLRTGSIRRVSRCPGCAEHCRDAPDFPKSAHPPRLEVRRSCFPKDESFPGGYVPPRRHTVQPAFLSLRGTKGEGL